MTFTRPTPRALAAVTTLTVDRSDGATVAPGDAATATGGSTYAPAREAATPASRGAHVDGQDVDGDPGADDRCSRS